VQRPGVRRSHRHARATRSVQRAADRPAEVNSRRDLFRSGPLDLRAERLDRNLRQGVRPEHATNVALSALVDETAADWRNRAPRWSIRTDMVAAARPLTCGTKTYVHRLVQPGTVHPTRCEKVTSRSSKSAYRCAGKVLHRSPRAYREWSRRRGSYRRARGDFRRAARHERCRLR
jgi:hypothetical protein